MATPDVPHGLWDPELDCFPSHQASPATRGASQEFEFGEHRTTKAEESPARTGFRKALESIRFSLGAGVAAPLICLVLDPMFFKGGDEHGPIFGQHWVLAYSFIALEVLVLTLWVGRRERLRAFSGVVAGALLAGSVLAAGLGLALLPFSLLGLLVIIGAVGFTPFLTSLAFYFNGIMAFRCARSHLRKGYLALSLALGAALALALPYSLQSGVQRGWRDAIRDLADGDASAIQRVQFFCRFLPNDGDHFPMETAIENEHDPTRKQRLVEGNRKLGY